MTMAKLTMTAKFMLRTGSSDSGLMPNENIERMIFRFAAHDDGKTYPAVEVDSREEWLRILRERGAEDFKLILTDEIDDYSQLTVFNKIPCVILCFGQDYVSGWNRVWTINPVNNKWVVILVETIIENPPKDKPRFGDVSQDMATLLPSFRTLFSSVTLTSTQKGVSASCSVITMKLSKIFGRRRALSMLTVPIMWEKFLKMFVRSFRHIGLTMRKTVGLAFREMNRRISRISSNSILKFLIRS